MASEKTPEGLASFATYVCLLYHEARNVRHLVKAGVLERERYRWLLQLPNNRERAWADLQGFRHQASRAESAAAACEVFASRYRLSLEDLMEVFANKGWRHSAYGGNRWAGIARSVVELRSAIEVGGAVDELVKTIAAMSHNTGRVEDKLRTLEASLGEPARGRVDTPSGSELDAGAAAVLKLESLLFGEWLTPFCEARSLSPAGFRRVGRALSVFEAVGTLRAMDEGLVVIDENGELRWPKMHGRLFPFHAGNTRVSPRPIKFARECFLAVAAAATLHLDHGWPVEHIVLESSRATRLDLALFNDPDEQRMILAGEAKNDSRLLDHLIATIKACSEAPSHDRAAHQAATSSERDGHRKYEGLLRDRPMLLWLLAPDDQRLHEVALTPAFGLTPAPGLPDFLGDRWSTPSQEAHDTKR